jgi:predicted nucleotidyltransferase component of viral defense system
VTKPLKNVGTSVRTRLLQLAKQRGDDFQLVLLRYVNERLLHRLATSAHADRFVLKGAALFTVWTGRPHRATRDLDLLGFGDSNEASLRDVFKDVVTLKTEDDGVVFDAGSLEVGPIRESQEYGGVRVTLAAHVAEAKVRVQIDVGFGDAITPEATEIDFPALLSFPAPRLRAYPRETVIAEKLDAMVQLGLANSRMKDFYDLKLLSELFDFDGELLVRAVRATFTRRGTPVPDEVPVALSPEFIGDSSKAKQWSAFASKSGAGDVGDFASVMEQVARFVTEPLEHARAKAPWKATWPKGGPWSK